MANCEPSKIFVAWTSGGNFVRSGKSIRTKTKFELEYPANAGWENTFSSSAMQGGQESELPNSISNNLPSAFALAISAESRMGVEFACGLAVGVRLHPSQIAALRNAQMVKPVRLTTTYTTRDALCSNATFLPATKVATARPFNGQP